MAELVNLMSELHKTKSKIKNIASDERPDFSKASKSLLFCKSDAVIPVKKSSSRSKDEIPISSRNQSYRSDLRLDDEEEKFEKSRSTLKQKTLLYDKLKCGSETIDEKDAERFLVDFQRNDPDKQYIADRKSVFQHKWDKIEDETKQKGDLHYQDVLFDEARSHGVGFMHFSRVEAERNAQHDLLKKLRDETKTASAFNAAESKKKKKEMDERLRKVRDRKRLKLGYPVIEPEYDPLKTPPFSDEEEEGEIRETETITEPFVTAASPIIEENIMDGISVNLRKIRDWDLGKPGVDKVMSQEEWTESRRKIRENEFAPPKLYSEREDESKNKKSLQNRLNIGFRSFSSTPKYEKEGRSGSHSRVHQRTVHNRLTFNTETSTRKIYDNMDVDNSPPQNANLKFDQADQPNVKSQNEFDRNVCPSKSVEIDPTNNRNASVVFNQSFDHNRSYERTWEPNENSKLNNTWGPNTNREFNQKWSSNIKRSTFQNEDSFFYRKGSAKIPPENNDTKLEIGVDPLKNTVFEQNSSSSVGGTWVSCSYDDVKRSKKLDSSTTGLNENADGHFVPNAEFEETLCQNSNAAIDRAVSPNRNSRFDQVHDQTKNMGTSVELEAWRLQRNKEILQNLSNPEKPIVADYDIASNASTNSIQFEVDQLNNASLNKTSGQTRNKVFDIPRDANINSTVSQTRDSDRNRNLNDASQYVKQFGPNKPSEFDKKENKSINMDLNMEIDKTWEEFKKTEFEDDLVGESNDNTEFKNVDKNKIANIVKTDKANTNTVFSRTWDLNCKSRFDLSQGQDWYSYESAQFETPNQDVNSKSDNSYEQNKNTEIDRMSSSSKDDEFNKSEGHNRNNIYERTWCPGLKSRFDQNRLRGGQTKLGGRPWGPRTDRHADFDGYDNRNENPDKNILFGHDGNSKFDFSSQQNNETEIDRMSSSSKDSEYDRPDSQNRNSTYERTWFPGRNPSLDQSRGQNRFRGGPLEYRRPWGANRIRPNDYDRAGNNNDNPEKNLPFGREGNLEFDNSSERNKNAEFDRMSSSCKDDEYDKPDGPSRNNIYERTWLPGRNHGFDQNRGQNRFRGGPSDYGRPWGPDRNRPTDSDRTSFNIKKFGTHAASEFDKEWTPSINAEFDKTFSRIRNSVSTFDKKWTPNTANTARPDAADDFTAVERLIVEGLQKLRREFDNTPI